MRKTGGIFVGPIVGMGWSLAGTWRKTGRTKFWTLFNSFICSLSRGWSRCPARRYFLADQTAPFSYHQWGRHHQPPPSSNATPAFLIVVPPATHGFVGFFAHLNIQFISSVVTFLSRVFLAQRWSGAFVAKWMAPRCRKSSKFFPTPQRNIVLCLLFVVCLLCFCSCPWPEFATRSRMHQVSCRKFQGVLSQWSYNVYLHVTFPWESCHGFFIWSKLYDRGGARPKHFLQFWLYPSG